jgi:hypothetical protein
MTETRNERKQESFEGVEEIIPIKSTKELLMEAFASWNSLRKPELKNQAGEDLINYTVNLLQEEGMSVPVGWLELINEIELADLGLERASARQKPFFLGKSVRLKSKLIGKISGLLYRKGYFVVETTVLRDFMQDDLAYRIPSPKQLELIKQEKKEDKREEEDEE